MCNKNKSRAVKTKKTEPARRCRSRTRKPKYLSLSKHIKTKSTPPPPPPPPPQSKPEPSEITKMPRQLKNLFPLHPESHHLATDADRDDNVALLFHSSDAAADLTALLQTTATAAATTSSDSLPLSYMYDNNDEQHRSLVESAMKRKRGRDASEEKWVCYSEVVEEVTSTSDPLDHHGDDNKKSVVWRSKKRKKKKSSTSKRDETTSSSGNTSTTTSISNNSKSKSESMSLALKLDYQGILNAWSDKGSLFIQRGDHHHHHHHFPDSSSPQTVPDLQYDLGLMDGWGSSVGNLLQVPESGGLKIKEEMELGKDGWKLGQREASVLRYKEKRQSRLFSKRIRYEVRKLNAEKRPRMKGRFVKIG